MEDDQRLGEIFEDLGKYSAEDPFDVFKMNTFFKAGPAERVALLLDWDRRMREEIKPSRETASLIAQKRQLDDLHALLLRGGR